MSHLETNAQFAEALAECRRVFEDKLHDYGPSWRILRPESLTDQLFIKAKRIRSLQTKGFSAVDEGILPEFIALVNYSFIAIIQDKLGFADTIDMNSREAIDQYNEVAAEAFELMKAKNHDYDEAWRNMRVGSYVDFILTKIERIREIENHGGETKVSEGVDSNYLDIANYATFGILKLTENAPSQT